MIIKEKNYTCVQSCKVSNHKEPLDYLIHIRIHLNYTICMDLCHFKINFLNKYREISSLNRNYYVVDRSEKESACCGIP